jgi:hypothetical protein
LRWAWSIKVDTFYFFLTRIGMYFLCCSLMLFDPFLQIFPSLSQNQSRS